MTALTRLASSAVMRADAPTREASMEMAGKLAACARGTESHGEGTMNISCVEERPVGR